MQSIDTHLRVQGGAALLGALIAFAISLPLAGIGFAFIAAVLGGVFCLVVASVLWEEHTTRPPEPRMKSHSGALT